MYIRIEILTGGITKIYLMIEIKLLIFIFTEYLIRKTDLSSSVELSWASEADF